MRQMFKLISDQVSSINDRFFWTMATFTRSKGVAFTNKKVERPRDEDSHSQISTEQRSRVSWI
jgi:hypothetical protein